MKIREIVVGAIMIILAVFFFMIAVRGCSRLITEVDKHGVKPIINQIWEGRDANRR